jgi:hypothetical protein
MEEAELEELESCYDCRAVLSRSGEASYLVNDDLVLCFECAVRRGGLYDSRHDDWTVPPNVADLPDERRPHA